MISCFLDPAIPLDSKCSYCCIYCNEDNCDYRCDKSIECKTEERVIESDCPHAYGC